MAKELKHGDALSGMLIDGVEGTPYVVGTLYYDDDGVHVSVPYVTRLPTGQFQSAEKWFGLTQPDVPANLRYEDNDTKVSLYGNEYRGSRTNFVGGTAVGRFSVGEAVAAQSHQPTAEPLLVRELRSEIDGLAEWTGFSASSIEPVKDDEGRVQRLNITVESKDHLHWDHGKAQAELSTNWQGREGGKALIDETVTLTTRFLEPRPAADHIAVHQSVRALVAVIFGQSVFIRQHQITGDAFPRTLGSGKVDYAFHHFLSSHTMLDHRQPRPENLASPLVPVSMLGREGLELWAANEAGWMRVVGPVVSLIQRQQPFVEDVILTTSMALEARGHMLEPLGSEPEYGRPGLPRNPSFTTYIRRCLTTLPVEWTNIAASPEGLATAMSKVYNGVKHPDRQAPDSLNAALLGQVQIWIARLCISSMLDSTGDIVKLGAQHSGLRQAMDAFEWNDRFINERGEFVRWADRTS